MFKKIAQFFDCLLADSSKQEEDLASASLEEALTLLGIAGPKPCQYKKDEEDLN